MRQLDGLRILGPEDVAVTTGSRVVRRELIDADDTGGRWRLGEVVAEPDDGVATHTNPGEPEAIMILKGEVELHGAQGVELLHPGDVVFIPPDTEHGLRTPSGGRWLAIWPIGRRRPGRRYASPG